MSYQGQTWVDEVALPYLENTGELVIMLRVANHAGNGPKKMSGCFAGSKTLAAECLMSPRAAQAHLRELTRRGLLIPGDPKLVEHIRADRRPPVYDLAAAHEPGCPGSHEIDGECQPSATGGRNDHPSPHGQNRRPAGSKNDHPSDRKPATGGKNRHPRVAKSATKSSKELKDSPLSPDAPSADAPPVPDAGEREREAAEPDNRNPTPFQGSATDVDKVVDSYMTAYIASTGMPPKPDAVRSVRAATTSLLSVGRSVGNLCTLASDLAAKGWTNLAQHAAMNPEAAIRPAVNRKPWCGECNNGREPMAAAQRMVETDTGMAKCRCHPGYMPAQPTHA